MLAIHKMLMDERRTAVSHLSPTSFPGVVTVRIRFQLLPWCSIRHSRLQRIPTRGARKNIPRNRDCCVHRSSQVFCKTPWFCTKLNVPITAEISGIRRKGIHMGLRFSLISSTGSPLWADWGALNLPAPMRSSPCSALVKRYNPNRSTPMR